ncbi:MAG TPA: M20/M25/M40 family metallo-hydrolase [Ktedonobacterales bacterium]|nr:M20/M25/M40 family metallo-hydrolase [Ktedonobacterales bacterium]
MAQAAADHKYEQALEARITETLLELAGLPSVSGQEAAVREYIQNRLEQRLKLAPRTDQAGNLFARLPGAPVARDAEPPLLLNAHMDRVPPGRAHTPIVADGVMRSDGATNLGADDSAGIAIVLHTVEELHYHALPHPPLLLLFTTGEEVGLTGAKAFDPAPWGAREGIVFDNAGEPGEIVTRAATYIAFDVTLRGSGGHPGKSLDGTASAIEMFRRAAYPFGSLDGDTTRVSIGRIEGGVARNAIPAELRAQGEARTLLEGQAQQALLQTIERAFTEAAASLGGSATVEFDIHCGGYTVSTDETLPREYMRAIERHDWQPRTITTFIGSDASALRGNGCAVFTVSTGAMEEHTEREWIALAPLARLTQVTVNFLSEYRAQ